MALTGYRQEEAARPASPQPGLFGDPALGPRPRLVIAVLLALLSLGPLLYMFSLSFQNNNDILGQHGAGPDPPHDEQLRPGLDRKQLRPLLLQQPAASPSPPWSSRSCLASLAAFAFARYKFPLREFIFYSLPGQPGHTQRAAADPPVPAHGPAPPARLARRAWSCCT